MNARYGEALNRYGSASVGTMSSFMSSLSPSASHCSQRPGVGRQPVAGVSLLDLVERHEAVLVAVEALELLVGHAAGLGLVLGDHAVERRPVVLVHEHVGVELLLQRGDLEPTGHRLNG